MGTPRVAVSALRHGTTVQGRPRVRGWCRGLASDTLQIMRAFCIVAVLAGVGIAPARAQDEIPAPPTASPGTPSAPTTAVQTEDPTADPRGPSLVEATEPAAPTRLPVLESPTRRVPPPPEPTEAALEEALPPTLDLPEWRVRAGGGVGIATGGETLVWGRATQEVDVQPRELQFLEFGLAAAQTVGPATIVQAGVRSGAFAWFCDEGDVRCQGAIDLQAGVRAGGADVAFDLGANLDLRLLIGEVFEVSLRGGFFSVDLVSFVNATGQAGLAF